MKSSLLWKLEYWTQWKRPKRHAPNKARERWNNKGEINKGPTTEKELHPWRFEQELFQSRLPCGHSHRPAFHVWLLACLWRHCPTVDRIFRLFAKIKALQPNRSPEKVWNKWIIDCFFSSNVNTDLCVDLKRFGAAVTVISLFLFS